MSMESLNQGLEGSEKLVTREEKEGEYFSRGWFAVPTDIFINAGVNTMAQGERAASLSKGKVYNWNNNILAVRREESGGSDKMLYITDPGKDFNQTIEQLQSMGFSQNPEMYVPDLYGDTSYRSGTGLGKEWDEFARKHTGKNPEEL